MPPIALQITQTTLQFLVHNYIWWRKSRLYCRQLSSALAVRARCLFYPRLGLEMLPTIFPSVTNSRCRVRPWPLAPILATCSSSFTKSYMDLWPPVHFHSTKTPYDLKDRPFNFQWRGLTMLCMRYRQLSPCIYTSVRHSPSNHIACGLCCNKFMTLRQISKDSSTLDAPIISASIISLWSSDHNCESFIYVLLAWKWLQS